MWSFHFTHNGNFIRKYIRHFCLQVATLKMSKSLIDNDGFQIVSSKNSSKKKTTVIPRKDQNFHRQEFKIDIEKLYRLIETALEDLEASEYSKQIIKTVSNILQNKNIVEIVCFGLGHIGECVTSRYQLALLLYLKNYFNPKKVIVHDPIFYIDECKLLKKFKLSVYEENTEGSYIIPKHSTTLVYFPHCPKQLTNNFLWSNWGINLENCILLCNSFTSLIQNHPNRILKDTVPYIQKIYPLTIEIQLENNFIYKDIFNDTAVHHFPKEKLESVPTDIWDYNDKPEYTDTEEFITSLMVERLNL